ncbi:GGDEF domain-containing protein [Thiomicrorhabdus sp. ZW0627]|uniref:sensor domain-containing diguanylate cyclase n=1 Tax=Thiomicrorhabdus sp. ZW0627 TaxID=3039774 RepID=UPI00243671FE|nr:GGDEF domain-containing protein [Thiomicrorhabdus sp. ZW0627]MDG6772844.1 GGDEF domain-containing protein [Thiomicrorhabdus sp. ZW0627]
MYDFRHFRIDRALLFTFLLIGLVFSSHSYAQAAQVENIAWKLYGIDKFQQFDPQRPESQYNLLEVDGISLTGGHYLYSGEVNIDQEGFYVVDFKNTSAIDLFSFYIYDQQNRRVATASGGIGSTETNPFFLRHGRTFHLKAGQYKLLAEVSSPYFIAQPVPYVDPLANYQQEIKLGNAIVLIGLGIFLSMGIYYGALSFARSRNTEVLYAIFIFSNLLFNAGAHQVLAQLFNLHNFYLISFPIVISNFIYVLFVMKLLEIHPAKNKILHLMGIVALLVLAVFALFGMLSPHWVNEMARFGVWVFLLYGLIAGVARSIQGSVVARLYLVALVVFIGLASMATLPTHLSSNTIYVEHYGLAAIAMEVILLALVLTYQFGELYRERVRILLRLDHSKKLAHTDAVTDIPNRYALEIELASFEQNSSLTYIDMDNLKFYNDRYGHAKGDEMLKMFASLMKQGLGGDGCIYRVGGDEFAVTCPDGNAHRVQKLIDRVIDEMHHIGFEQAGVSAGSAFMHEAANTSDLKHLADIRMYENKQHRKSKSHHWFNIGG